MIERPAPKRSRAFAFDWSGFVNWALDLLRRFSARCGDEATASESERLEGDPHTLRLAGYALRTVVDPELGINIVDLGLLYGLRASPELVEVETGVTGPSCPLAEHIARADRTAVKGVVGSQVPVDVTVNRERRWSPDRVSPEARRLLEVG